MRFARPFVQRRLYRRVRARLAALRAAPSVSTVPVGPRSVTGGVGAGGAGAGGTGAGGAGMAGVAASGGQAPVSAVRARQALRRPLSQCVPLPAIASV